MRDCNGDGIFLAFGRKFIVHNRSNHKILFLHFRMKIFHKTSQNNSFFENCFFGWFCEFSLKFSFGFMLFLHTVWNGHMTNLQQFWCLTLLWDFSEFQRQTLGRKDLFRCAMTVGGGIFSWDIWIRISGSTRDLY